MKILANDGIDAQGAQILQDAGFEVLTSKVAQDQLAATINEQHITGLLVRSATKVRKDVIDACPGLKLIGRGGVGMDNIDVAYAREKGLHVINTPAASSESVAELVIAHLFSLCRFLNDAHLAMPNQGSDQFNDLKKKYGKGLELRGKTLGIVGFGRIGQSVASYALGLGMKVRAFDVVSGTKNIELVIGSQEIKVPVKIESFDDVISKSDFITLHIPAQKDGQAVISAAVINQMKNGAILINAARGGVVDEDALLQALDEGKLAGAGLDVFNHEPTPDKRLLTHPKISSTPHIGAATLEAQERISIELAEQIKSLLKPVH